MGAPLPSCFFRRRSRRSRFSPSPSTSSDTADYWNNLASDRLKLRLGVAGADITRLIRFQLISEPRPKNVVFFLGDGMGIPIITAGRDYRNRPQDMDGLPDDPAQANAPFSFDRFESMALVGTSSYSHLVTDSAAAAMALFSGRKVVSETLGRVPGSPDDCSGDPEETRIREGIAEIATGKGLRVEETMATGMSVGVVTNTRITDATPAALYAHDVGRYFEADRGETTCTDIASQILEYPANKFKVVFEGKDVLGDPWRWTGSFSSDERRFPRQTRGLSRCD